jgi:hypothetical protein
MGEKNATDTKRRRHAKPARLPLVSEADARLAEAELRTSQALEALDPDHWTVVKDLAWPGGRYGHVDHVVVGPSGVYVVDTKTWSGDVSVYGDRLRHEGVIQDSEVASMTDAAAGVALLTPGVPQQLVKPVLCVSGGEALDTHVSGMLVCSTDTLVPMLEARVHRMSTHQIHIAGQQLRDHLHDRGLVRVAARAGHSEVKKKDFVPMRGVPVIRIAIACWFASTVVLAPHVFTDAYNTIHDRVDKVQQEFENP